MTLNILTTFHWDEGLQLLYENTGIQLRGGQKWAPSGLHRGSDIYCCQNRVWQDIDIYRVPLLLHPSKDQLPNHKSINGPLSRIRPLDLQASLEHLPAARRLTGRITTPEFGHSIITGNYTHIWVSGRGSL